MKNEQSDLSKWGAGFFDGDGSILAEVSESSTSKVGYSITPKCSVTNSYVGGLFDAEGCVSCSIAPNERSAVSYHAKPKCQITQRENDPLLKKLENYLDSIDVDYSTYHREYDGNKSDNFTIEIRKRESIKIFLGDLMEDIVVKETQSNIMLNDIIPLLESGEHGTRRGFLKVMRHVDRMNSLKGGVRGKYNLEYFEDKWGMKLD